MKYELPDELTVTADGAVRTVLINRPDDLNCVNENLHWALANVWRQLAADKEARVVILSGAGRAFCAGGDRIPAATAVELGFASRRVPAADLMGEASTLAGRLAAQPVEALQGTKRVVNMYLSQAMAGPLQAGFAAEVVTMRSEDHRRRLLAFRERAT